MRKPTLEERIRGARKYAFENKGTLCIITINESAIEAHFLGEAIQFPSDVDTKVVAEQSIDWAMALRKQKQYAPKIKMRMLV